MADRIALHEASQVIFINEGWIGFAFCACLQANLIDEVLCHFGCHHSLYVSLDVLIRDLVVDCWQVL
jgi:urea transporter